METQHFLQYRLDKAGDFRAFAVDWTVEETTKADSQSVGIAINFAIKSEWFPDRGDNEPSGWSEEWAPGYFATGRIYIVGKDGQLIQANVDRLMKAGLWDGDFDKFASQPPATDVIIQVKHDTYQGKDQYKVDWINPDADQPPAHGGFAPTNPQVLDSLRARFGSQVRALSGGRPKGNAPSPQAAQAMHPAGSAPQHHQAASPQQHPQHGQPAHQPVQHGQPQPMHPAGAPQPPHQHDPAAMQPGANPGAQGQPQGGYQPNPGQQPQQGQQPQHGQQPGGGPAGWIDPNASPF